MRFQALFPSILFVGRYSSVAAWIPAHHHGTAATKRIAVVARSTAVSVERTAEREVAQFQDWIMQCGVSPENGFCLEASEDEDWHVATSTGGTEGSRVLYVPAELILSSSGVAQDYQGYFDASIAILQQKGHEQFVPQFLLFLKILVEYETGYDSPYYSWIASLPRNWKTAASMDDFCLSCLPPFIKSLCQTQLNQVDSFREALQQFDYVSEDTKRDLNVIKFAYNVVMTRATKVSEDDYQIVLLADMFNHGHPPNVELAFDPNDGSCHALLTRDVQPGEELYISYGEPTNPSRFLAKYGFLNDGAPAAYCKMLFPNPSQEMVDIGCDPNKLLFYTADGGIAEEVWDVLLYSRLERKKEATLELRTAFHQAHLTGDAETKAAIHDMYFQDTYNALRRHVDNILAEVADLRVKTNAYDSSKHPRLPMIRKHNDMVFTTFERVRDGLALMVEA